MYRLIIFVSILSLLAACQKENKKDNFVGNYATDSYLKRNEGYDWVGVRITKNEDESYHINVRSRADKKNPTCTFDAEATCVGKDSLMSKYEGHSFLYLLNNDTLTIKGIDKESDFKLYYFCSGGASLSNKYIRTKAPLDESQIEKTIFRTYLSYDKQSVYIMQKGDKVEILLRSDKNSKDFSINVQDTIRGAEWNDIDGDNFPELFIYSYKGKNRYGKVTAFTTNKEGEFEKIVIPLTSPELLKNYEGHDEYATVENNFVRRFTARKKTKQFQYKLVPSDKGKKLQLDKVVEF